MTIPDEDVEAAAKHIYEDGWGGPPFWESMAADHPARLTSLATALGALEAAAPHMYAACGRADFTNETPNQTKENTMTDQHAHHHDDAICNNPETLCADCISNGAEYAVTEEA